MEGDREIERWFLASTLFGTRISTSIAVRTYRVLSEDGVSTIDDAAGRSWAELVGLLDRGGYARYDERTARGLLDALPGWGRARSAHSCVNFGECGRRPLSRSTRS